MLSSVIRASTFVGVRVRVGTCSMNPKLLHTMRSCVPLPPVWSVFHCLCIVRAGGCPVVNGYNPVVECWYISQVPCMGSETSLMATIHNHHRHHKVLSVTCISVYYDGIYNLLGNDYVTIQLGEWSLLWSQKDATEYSDPSKSFPITIVCVTHGITVYNSDW